MPLHCHESVRVVLSQASGLRRGIASGALFAAFAGLSFACGDTMPATRDVVTDRAAPDSSGAMDAAAEAAVPPMDVATPPADTAAPPLDVPVSNSCCRAFAPANQGMCDGLEALGRDRCAMVNDGTSCAWSLDARCNDSGAPAMDSSAPVDAGPPPNCCLAISPANAAICSALSPFGRDRCNRLDGGGTCVWSGAGVCNVVTPPMDAGAADAMVSDAAPDARDAGPDVRDAGIPTCCLARTGARGTLCRTSTTMAACAAQPLLNTCVWATSANCTNPLGANGACCMGLSALFTSTCQGYSTAAQCMAVAGRCNWRCP